MAKIILMCGKVCSGKTTYAKKLCKEGNTILLSADELMLTLFGQHVGDKHNEMLEKSEFYLHGKAEELIKIGIDVIYDLGFWGKDERKSITKSLTDKGIKVEWHYIDVSDETWHKNLNKRNNEILNGKQDAYYIDDNIAKKFHSLFEEPTHDEIDVWINNDWT